MTNFWGLTEEQIEESFHKSPDLVCLTEFGGSFKRVNSNWTKLMGWSAEELLSRPHIEFVHPKDVEKTIEYEKEFIPAGFENRYRCKDGSYRYLKWTGLSPIATPTVSHKLVFSIAYDITLERLLTKEREKKIKILNEHVQFNTQILQTIKDIQFTYLGELAACGRCEFAKEGSTTQIIKHFVQLSNSEFGFIAETNNFDFNFQVYYSDKTILGRFSTDNLHLISSLMKEGKMYTGPSDETTILGKVLLQSSVHTFLAYPLTIKSEFIGFVVLANRKHGYPEQLVKWLDPLFFISACIINGMELHRSNARNREQDVARQVAETASTTKSSFLAHMSHELRTPLGGMLGLIEIIDKKRLSDEDKQHLITIEECGYSLLTLLNDILDLSKIEDQQLRLEEIPFSPQTIIEEVVHLLKFQCDKKLLPLFSSVDRHVPPSLIGDPTRFRQILLNLLGNAIKFTSQGSISISLGGFINKKEQNCYQIEGTITDTGIGMDPPSQEKLFQSFSQADTSMTRRFGGSGLGLYITKQLCQAMGGDVNVTSQLGIGSAFRFHLLLRLPNETRSGEGRRLSAETLELPTSLSILIAEDNPINQTILRKVLLQSGCTSITIASNGREAIDAIMAHSFDIVLMDGQMPEMDGLQATREIRRHFDSQVLPIIAVTAHAMVGDCEKFLEAGMNGYLTKPIKKRALVEEILRCLDITKQSFPRKKQKQ